MPAYRQTVTATVQIEVSVYAPTPEAARASINARMPKLNSINSLDRLQVVDWKLQGEPTETP